jgi:PIN domain nuclease of toxin-antitoxin system
VRVLVDTHSFLWELLGDKRSSKNAIRILGSEDNELLFSMVSLWEIAINMRLGRMHGLGSSVAYVRDMAGEYAMEILPVRYEHILALETLPLHHRDPFDRMLIAQGIAEGVPVLTNDAKFKLYDGKVVW